MRQADGGEQSGRGLQVFIKVFRVVSSFFQVFFKKGVRIAASPQDDNLQTIKKMEQKKRQRTTSAVPNMVDIVLRQMAGEKNAASTAWGYSSGGGSKSAAPVDLGYGLAPALTGVLPE